MGEKPLAASAESTSPVASKFAEAMEVFWLLEPNLRDWQTKKIDIHGHITLVEENVHSTVLHVMPKFKRPTR